MSDRRFETPSGRGERPHERESADLATSDVSYTRIAVVCERCGGAQVARRMPDGRVQPYSGSACSCGGTAFTDLSAAESDRR